MTGMSAAEGIESEYDRLVLAIGLDQRPARERGNLEDATYERMRQALVDGRFHPGQTFTIRALAAVFGTSPMPVRDALKRLVAERTLHLLPNRSVIVPLMSRDRFLEILDVRLALESMLAMRAARTIGPDAIQAMADDHEQMCVAVAQGDAAGYLSSNRRFHFRLYEAANTVVLLPVVETMWAQIGPYLNQVFGSREKGTERAGHHHTEVLRALRRRDGEAAARGIRQDISDAADSILETNWFSA